MAKKKAKNKGGRKGLYHKWIKPENVKLIEAWKRRGLTNEQVAKNIGIAAGTLYEWQKKYPEIAEALEKGRDSSLAEVENAAFKGALGYDYEEVRTYITIDKEGNKTTKVDKVSKHQPPNSGLIIFILRNLGRPYWSNRPEEEAQFELNRERAKLENRKLTAMVEMLEEAKSSAAGKTAFENLISEMLGFQEDEEVAKDE